MRCDAKLCLRVRKYFCGWGRGRGRGHAWSGPPLAWCGAAWRGVAWSCPPLLAVAVRLLFKNEIGAEVDQNARA